MDLVKPRTWSEAWADADRIQCWAGVGSPYWTAHPLWYRALSWSLTGARSVVEKSRATRALLGGLDVYLDDPRWPMRIKTLVLMWLLPVRWTFPSGFTRVERNAHEVANYDGRQWAGAEQTCWSATFVHAPYGWHLGRVFISEESGP